MAPSSQVDVQGKAPSSANGDLARYLLEKVCPQLPDPVQPSFIAAVEGGNIKSMPNRAMPPASAAKAGVFLIGDALNMRHPLTGGGMTVAIRDVEALVEALCHVDVTDVSAQASVKQAFYLKRREYSSTINVLANALHSVFSTPGMDPTRVDLREACFDYLQLGGVFSAGPVGLLSGLTPKPAVLATHFFMVAIYAAKNYLLPFPTPFSVVRMYKVLHVACQIIMPLLTQERATVLAAWPVRTAVKLIFPYRSPAVPAQ
jgi:squalene monooxygenase